ncbi:MAG: DUF1653 domain-containing protein [Candidatus Micrarchaeota archaeon]|nr:DUF1653 domain-containing protein [Candidatus Micrarchaeota archaeon]
MAGVRLGRYRHYKSKEYRVIGLAKHSETLEELVIYKALYGRGQIWARPKRMFSQSVSAEGKRVPRFRYVGKS